MGIMNQIEMFNQLPMNNKIIMNNQMIRKNQTYMKNQIKKNNQRIINEHKQMYNQIQMNNQMVINDHKEMNEKNIMKNQKKNINNFMLMEDLLMDDETSRIKVIIQPYEEKIKKLEEEISKKNLQIAILNEKLYLMEKKLSNINKQNLMKNMNMIKDNQLFLEDIDKNSFSIIFNYYNKKYIELCLMYEKFELVERRISKKLNLDSKVIFVFNAKVIEPNLTIQENGITNNSIIQIFKINPILKKIYQKNNNLINSDFIFEEKKEEKKEDDYFSNNKRCLIFQNNNRKTYLLFDENTPIGLAIRNYLKQIGSINDDYHLAFIHNSKRLTANDNCRIKDIFDPSGECIILVIDLRNSIGA